jgi:hypothetical protein
MTRITGTIALVLLLALGVCSSAASAAPLSMTFTEGRANVGVQLSVANDDDALFKAPDMAPFAAQIDPGSGLITNGVLGVPEFSTFITTPISSLVTVEFDIGAIDGSFDQATGALALKGTAGGTLTANGGECIVSTTPAILELKTSGSTGGTTSLSGVPFAAGLTGSGAIAGEWTDMHAAPLDPGPGGDTGFCEDVEDQIGGSGGVWLEREDNELPAPPQLVGTNPSSPSLSGTPRILGAAEAGSTVRVYAGSNCAGTPVATGSATELRSPGIAVQVAEDVTAAFSATATDAAGNASACSAPILYTRLKALPPACVVPDVVGKKLKAAKRTIKAAGCKVGKVQKPKRLKGKGRRVLVVKSSSPAAGVTLEAGGKVNLRLGPKPQKARR